MSNTTLLIQPGSFDSPKHFYPKVLNASIHPMVQGFLNMSNDQIEERFCHLHPEVNRAKLKEVFNFKPKHLSWSGADLFCVVNEKGQRKMMLVELNSCPSGQKSMPWAEEFRETGGYLELLKRSFLPQLKRRTLPKGKLAVIYDKNYMETSGYAAALADLMQTPVYLVPFFNNAEQPLARFDQGVLQIRHQETWVPIRAAFRYVTQKPWNRIPPNTKTYIYNSTLSCLAGGRNKLMAAKAYDFLNAELKFDKLEIRTPETIWDVNLEQVPLWVERMGGIAVVKNPYSNAGQGVYTITNKGELDQFMAEEHSYKKFIVQALIGNSNWSSRSREILYHVGTVPNKKLQIFAADVRMMVGSGPDGFFPVSIYARRAAKPLTNALDPSVASWDMLGTNLSSKNENGQWITDPGRLYLMDRRDFNKLGIGLDDLIEAYIQTILSTIAIDRIADSLLTSKGVFRRRYFRTLNPDQNLVEEIMT